MLKKIFLLSTSALGFLCSYLYYEMYYKWNFDENGKAFDGESGVVYDSSSSFWIFLSLVFFGPIIIFFIRSLANKIKS